MYCDMNALGAVKHPRSQRNTGRNFHCDLVYSRDLDDMTSIPEAKSTVTFTKIIKTFYTKKNT